MIKKTAALLLALCLCVGCLCACGKELILRYTNELPPQQKLVFMLRDVEELEVIEVQTITGLSPEKIKSTLYLARKNIRNKMNQIDPDL